MLESRIAEAVSGARVIDKPGFGSLDLADILLARNDKEPIEIEMVGLCTDICVVSNAVILKAKLPETKITVDGSCCAGVTPKTHEEALDVMRMCQINIA